MSDRKWVRLDTEEKRDRVNVAQMVEELGPKVEAARHCKLAVVHHKAGRFESAIREYSIALAGDSNHSREWYMNAIWRCQNELPHCSKDEACILCASAKEEGQGFCFGCKTHHDTPCQPEWLGDGIQEWTPL